MIVSYFYQRYFRIQYNCYSKNYLQKLLTLAYKNFSENEKQKLVEYRKKYRMRKNVIL